MRRRARQRWRRTFRAIEHAASSRCDAYGWSQTCCSNESASLPVTALRMSNRRRLRSTMRSISACRIEARGGRAMAMPCLGGGAEQDTVSVLPRAHAPFDIFPVERIVDRGSRTYSRSGRVRNKPAPPLAHRLSRARVAPSGAAWNTRIPVTSIYQSTNPVSSRLRSALCCIICAAMAKTSSARRAASSRSAAGLERHVVVQEQCPVVSRCRESAPDRRAESERPGAVDELDEWVFLQRQPGNARAARRSLRRRSARARRLLRGRCRCLPAPRRAYRVRRDRESRSRCPAATCQTSPAGLVAGTPRQRDPQQRARHTAARAADVDESAFPTCQ